MGTLIIITGLLALGGFCVFEALRRARIFREAGFTPDGAPLPRFGDFVRAVIDAPLAHGGRTIVVLDYDPSTVEGMVTEVNAMTMRVMDESGESFRCLIVGYVPIDPPAWFTAEHDVPEAPDGEVINDRPNIVMPPSDMVH